MQPHEFELIIVDPIRELCAAMRYAFEGLPRARVAVGRFEELPEFDCMVSAANSFGLMDGGVDLAITRYFGEQLQSRVQRHIIEEWRGEQPVGTSFLIETMNARHPWLAHTPTMRVPLPIARTDNIYRAMQAMLLAVWRHNRTGSQPIRTVACPGLGTLTGRVPFEQAAEQMATAYRHFLDPPEEITWHYARSRQAALGHAGGDSAWT